MPPTRIRLCFVAVLMGLAALPAAGAEFRTVQIKSTRDGADQPALFYAPPPGEKPVPLLVVLHTWGGGYDQKGFGDDCLVEAGRRGWALIQPHFRGPNVRPEACASALAVQDVLDAVAYARDRAKVDASRIYLVGSSGGGHMALVMAGRAPALWAGVSAWVPISDLAGWHGECLGRGQRFIQYARNLEKICGGPPRASEAVDREYRERSPLTHLAGAKGVPLDINAGIDDGHTGSVPVRHSLRAFNLAAATNGQPGKQLTDAQVEVITERRTLPPDLATAAVEEPGRKHKVLLRREAGPARVTVFQGGHEGDMTAAVKWLAGQVKKAP